MTLSALYRRIDARAVRRTVAALAPLLALTLAALDGVALVAAQALAEAFGGLR